MVWAAVVTALTMAAAVVVERAAFGVQQALDRRLAQRYRPLVQRALAGDDAARDELLRQLPRDIGSRSRWLVIEPLIEDRDPERIVEDARDRGGDVAVPPSPTATCGAGCGGGARSRCARSGSCRPGTTPPQLVAALDDAHPDVRAAALDALTDHARPGGAAGHRRAAARHFPAPRPARRGAQGVRIRRASRSCWSGRRSIRQTASTTSTPSPSAAPPGRGPSCAAGLATPASRYAQRHLKRWRTWGSTTRPRVSPWRGWRATTRRSGRWRPTRCAAGRAPATRPPASRRISTIRGRSPSGPRERFGPWGMPASLELQARASRPDLGGLLARQMLWQAGAHR